MDKKKILIVCKGFYPMQSPRAFRATELAKEFARQGHKVTVLTEQKDFDYTDFLKKHPIILKNYGKLSWKQLTKSKYRLIGDWKRKFGRLLFMLFDYPNIEIMWRLKRHLKKEQNYDLLISIAVPYPIHWGVAWARTNENPIAHTWVADCGDPFMGNTLESFRYPFYFAFLEKWFSRKANYITIPVESAITGYYKEFHSKIKIIPQGFNFENISSIQDTKWRPSPRPEFAYAGGVAPSGVRSPLNLIEFLLSREDDYRFHIFATTDTGFLVPMVEKSKGKIIVHPPESREKLLSKLSEMSFLINLNNGTHQQVPSKLIDYALTKRPILNISPLNPEGNTIEEFLKGNYSQAYQVNNIKQYNIKNVTKQFLKLIR